MSYPIFYYFLKNERTGEEKRVTSSEYLGDVNQKCTEDWIIEDWCMEELDFC